MVCGGEVTYSESLIAWLNDDGYAITRDSWTGLCQACDAVVGLCE
jgi:alpha-amylase/alpha-mannosidase (GH57 family)